MALWNGDTKYKKIMSVTGYMEARTFAFDLMKERFTGTVDQLSTTINIR